MHGISGRALLSTSQFVYLVDLATGKSAKISSGQGLYYGISWDRYHIYIACADFHRWLRKWTRPKVLVFNDRLRKVAEIKPSFKIRGGVHQIHFDPVSEILWMMSSKDDAALILQDGRWEKWHPIEEDLAQWRRRLGDRAKKRWDQPSTDIHHLNSVWLNDGRIYMVAHNWGPSEVYVFDQSSRRLLSTIPMGNWAHNVWTEGEELLICSSGDGKVINQRGEEKYQARGFVRGAALTKTFRLLGDSDKADRRNRSKTNGRVHLLTQDWQVCVTWDFPGAGQILEIRVLGELDFCHNGMAAPVDPSVLEQPVSTFGMDG